MTPELFLSLAAPFPPDDVGWKPQSVKGNRALAIAYIDARNVMDRLDEVVHPGGWKDAYDVIQDGSVVCHLSLKVDGEWLTKSDVGSPSEQPDGGDRLKAAFSDALKRAAVKWGIGRYLYSLPHQWADYDPRKRSFVSQPRLPDWAVPKAAKASAPKPEPTLQQAVVDKLGATPVKPAGLPATGAELHQRLRDADADLAAKGLCQIGALLAHVTQVGIKAGFGADLRNWSGPAIELAVAETKAFKAKLPASGSLFPGGPQNTAAARH